MQQPGFWRSLATTGFLGTALAVSCVLGATSSARADIDRFPYTYSWSTAAKNEIELGVRHLQPTNAQHWQDQYEIEYGVTDRYIVEAYVIMNKSGGFRDYSLTSADGDDDTSGSGSQIFDPIRTGSAYRSGGYKIEQRYRFGDYRYKKLLPAAYLEYEDVRGTNPELEGKIILQYDPDSHETFALNLTTEQPVRGGGKTAWGYSLGGSYIVGVRQRFWYGAEAFGNWTGKQHWVGPSAGGYIADKTRLVGTYGRKVSGSNTGDQFQLLLTRELQ